MEQDTYALKSIVNIKIQIGWKWKGGNTIVVVKTEERIGINHVSQKHNQS